MQDDSRDPIIDAGLEELLGGITPPDLTDRILNSLDISAGDGSRSRFTPHESSPQHVDSSITVADRRRSGEPVKRVSPWVTIVAGISIAAIGMAITWWIVDDGPSLPEGQNPIALPLPQQEPLDEQSRSNSGEAVVSLPQDDPLPKVLDDRGVIVPSESMLVEERSAEFANRGREIVAQVLIPDDRPAALSDDQIVHSINQLIQDKWDAVDLETVDVATDEQWCRRVYLKLVGREPTAAESSTFLKSASSKKRNELVDLLLTGDTYVEEFAGHWSQIWSDILVATGNRRANRNGLEQFLRRSFGSGKPFDQTTFELLTAIGSTAIGSEDYNGATNYLVSHSSRDGVHRDATEHISRTFMGVSMQCAECHVDSTWSGVEQQKFWELNAFFRQLQVRRDRDKWVVSNATANRQGGQGNDGEVYFDTLDGRLKSAFPVFVDGTAIPLSPVVDEVNRRDLLAKFVTRSEQFRQAMANRFWYELFGVGFTVPPDNIGPHNPPSHPELLSKLGAQFAAHDYDVRSLIRWIVLSKPFALSEDDVVTDDQIRGRLVFDRFPASRPSAASAIQQLRFAEEVYASLRQQESSLATPANVTPSIPGTVPMELSDVDKLLASVTADARRLSTSTVYGNVILASDLSNEQKILHMFYATLHRAPTVAEQKAVERVIEEQGGSAGADTMWQYVWWALASSREAQ